MSEREHGQDDNYKNLEFDSVIQNYFPLEGRDKVGADACACTGGW